MKCFRTGLDFTNRSPHFVASYPVPCSHAFTQLHISPYGSSQLSALVYLLQCVPRLRHLRLRAQLEGQPDCVDPVFWEKFFHTHLLELKQLSLCVDIRMLYCVLHISDTEPRIRGRPTKRHQGRGALERSTSNSCWFLVSSSIILIRCSSQFNVIAQT